MWVLPLPIVITPETPKIGHVSRYYPAAVNLKSELAESPISPISIQRDLRMPLFWSQLSPVLSKDVILQVLYMCVSAKRNVNTPCVIHAGKGGRSGI
jgi:hypothetical protein